jgi:hypothetical protein
MSYQYRVWQEKLVSALKVATSSHEEQYVLLHSATLVGLFTCIFIRQRERLNIRNLSATEVKTGLGGLHGNKVIPYYFVILTMREHWSSVSQLMTPRCVSLIVI